MKMSEPKYGQLWQTMKRTTLNDALALTCPFRGDALVLYAIQTHIGCRKCAHYYILFRTSHIVNKCMLQILTRQQKWRRQPCTRLPQPITENEFNISSKN